jgi:NAD(P)-dependent dehydrogenase (short-subunit alcohol dehydrogenase family)
MSESVLEGQVALVTGAGRGLGRAFAIGLANAGARVAAVARSKDQVEETAGMMRDSGGTANAIAADVSDPASVTAMHREVVQTLGPVDVLVNCAGSGGPFGPTWERSAEDWWRAFEVNVRGPLLTSHAVLPGMISRRRGRIINIASGAGTRPIPYMSAYVSSKGALIRFTEVLAVETQEHGVSIFAIQPGTVRTAMVDDVLNTPGSERWFPWLRQILDGGHDVTTEPATSLVLYLASGKADALSGRFFIVPEDPAEVVSRIDEVLRDDLYTLRLQRLKFGLG